MFDIIGDVHGCANELVELLVTLGYFDDSYDRTVVFCGDLCDRGPLNASVLVIAMAMAEEGDLVCLGNHDDKLRRFLRGNNVSVSHGLDITLDQISARPPEFAAKVSTFLESLPYQLVLDNGKLIVTHAGLPEKYHGVESKKARSISLYGKTTGKSLANGFPERLDWAEDYTGDAVVVHGHVASPKPIVKNNVYNIDTACVFGGSLTALRYPEMNLVSIPAHKEHCKRNF